MFGKRIGWAQHHSGRAENNFFFVYLPIRWICIHENNSRLDNSYEFAGRPKEKNRGLANLRKWENAFLFLNTETLRHKIAKCVFMQKRSSSTPISILKLIPLFLYYIDCLQNRCAKNLDNLHSEKLVKTLRVQTPGFDEKTVYDVIWKCINFGTALFWKTNWRTM